MDVLHLFLINSLSFQNKRQLCSKTVISEIFLAVKILIILFLNFNSTVMYILYSILSEKGSKSFCLAEGKKSWECAKKKKRFCMVAWRHHSHGTVAPTAALVITQYTFVTPWIASKSLNTAKVCIHGWAGRKCCTHRTPTPIPPAVWVNFEDLA